MYITFKRNCFNAKHGKMDFKINLQKAVISLEMKKITQA